ncbi:ATP-binding cassette domain-containing protein [Peribacillus frigoritolerans]|uniref:ATP-binding cassette domain-containing protein n=1 Tax=Peribacillus frigoritolerans TaxID=450367 RepID=UPI0033061B2A
MISISNLVKSYKKKIILGDLNFKIPENKISFLMGENGVGKTTLIKCLLNLENYQGEILFDGNQFSSAKNDIYVVYDDTPFYLHLSGYKNITLLLNKKVTLDRVKEVASHYLNDDILKSKVKGYSYGQRKKLSLIIATLSEPKYLFLDEVSNGLDFETMEFLKEKLQEWSKNMTILTVGHQFDFYSTIIDELFLLKDSSITHITDYSKESGELSEIYKRIVK